MAALSAILPAQAAAGADIAVPLGVFIRDDGSGYGVTGVNVTANVAVTGAATNNYALTVRQMRAGVLVQNIATVTFASGTNLAVETPSPLTVTATSLQKGDLVDVLMHQNGTGIAVAVGTVAVQVNVG